MKLTATILAALLLAVPAYGQIDDAAIAAAAESVVVERVAVADAHVRSRSPWWRDMLHHGCIGALMAINWTDYRTTTVAIRGGAVEANPIIEPLVADGEFRDFAAAKAIMATVVAAVLEWLYVTQDDPTARGFATGLCGAFTGATVWASENNFQVIEEQQQGLER